jgi:adenine C2-methylase RlmN of 23S rRNA A2503 and tRNA A37
MTWVMSNLVSVHLETVLVLEQDRYTVCVQNSVR